jgi:beta-N-acetylhexosaminidase
VGAPLNVIFGCADPVLTAVERRFFATTNPWGFILFARNVQTPDQLRALCADLRAAVGRHAPILVDQEGGRVQRLAPPYWRQYLPPLDQMACASDPIRAMFLRGQLIGQELSDVGIDVNCAPIADIASNTTHPFLQNRCLGWQADAVSSAARAFANGLMAAGVLPVLKHIPGHGRSQTDSHKSLPVVDTDITTLRATDFAPFRALADLPMAMTAHVLFTAIDATAPATTSQVMIEVIRRDIGFGGLLISDDLSMQALVGDVAHRAAQSLAAGCDLALHCNGELAAMAAIADVCTALSGPALLRANAALAGRAAPETVDFAGLWAEFEALGALG